MGAAGERRVTGLVLAAGAGRRFGAIKQLAPLHGRPLIEHALRTMAAVPELDEVVVALGAHAQEIVARADQHGARPLFVEAWEEGQAASLRAAVAALSPQVGALLVTLGDQPAVGQREIARVLAAGGASELVAARAVHAGVPGHPVLLKRPLFAALSLLHGDRGARTVLDGVEVLEVECGPGAVLDVDTPTQLSELERPRG
ncbi:MAG: NTP transferase domain-containing protein [Conexibacter sp.]